MTAVWQQPNGMRAVVDVVALHAEGGAAAMRKELEEIINEVAEEVRDDARFEARMRERV